MNVIIAQVYLVDRLRQVFSGLLLPCGAVVLRHLPSISQLLLGGLRVDAARIQLCGCSAALQTPKVNVL